VFPESRRILRPEAAACCQPRHAAKNRNACQLHERYDHPRRAGQSRCSHIRVILISVVVQRGNFMRVLFIGGTGNISSACTRLAVERGIELYVFNRGQSARPGYPPG